jgi:hypothetical protein
MSKEDFCHIAELTSLRWPLSLEIPSKRFRLLVAADMTDIPVDLIREFAHAALERGMVYFCAWGPGCERFHDILDELVVADDIGERQFAGPNDQDTIMTAWHDDETLDEALDFFVNMSHPTDGFESESDYWLAICLDNPEWAATSKRCFKKKLN